MTNPRVRHDQTAKGNLKSLVQALDKLFDDQNTLPHLSLPDETLAEIQRSFTINTLAGSAIGSGIANDACD